MASCKPLTNMKRSFILTEISSIGICLLLISQMMFPETFTGAWFRYAILTLMVVTILSTQKGERLRVYDRQRQLCLTPFLWCYWWVEKILIGITVLCLFVSKWGIYSALSVFLLFLLGIYLGLKAAVYLIEYAIRRSE